jgi:hypothetical protein
VFVRVFPWLFIGFVALVLRLYGLRYGLPAVYNPDEVAIMSRALAFAKGDLNPHNFLYPSFYFYVLFAWEGLTAALAVASRAVDSFGAFQREFFIDPTRVFVAGRLLSALLGTATVIATGLLGARLTLHIVGPIAALLLAVAPLHVLNSHYVKHDVPVTFLIVLAYLAYDRLWNRDLPPKGGSYRNQGEAGRVPIPSRSFRLQAELPLLAAAAISGAAFSTHYYAIFLAIPLAWSAARGAGPGDAVKRIAIAALVSAAVFFLLSPFILVEPATALRDIRANREIVVDRAAEDLGYLGGAARYGQMLLLDTVGWPAAILALAGIAIGARRDAARTLWLLAFPVPFLLFISGTYPASRYLVPIVPFMTLFAAIAVVEVWRHRRFATVGTVLLAIAFVGAALESVNIGGFIRQTDTRTLALEFITARVPAGSTILSQPYSVPLEPTADALRESVARSGREMPLKTRLQLERDPYPSPAYRVLLIGQGLDADKLYVPVAQLGGNDPLAALRREHVAFVVLKRYNSPDPATLPFIAALAREGRRIAVFSPYRDLIRSDRQAEPFLHNTDARIVAALERPGPVVEIWQIDGPGS